MMWPMGMDAGNNDDANEVDGGACRHQVCFLLKSLSLDLFLLFLLFILGFSESRKGFGIGFGMRSAMVETG